LFPFVRSRIDGGLVYFPPFEWRTNGVETTTTTAMTIIIIISIKDELGALLLRDAKRYH